MKICFPVAENHGLESEVCRHFGSAPLFFDVDTETRELSLLDNGDEHNGHGACLKVYRAEGLASADNITCLGMDELPHFYLRQTCGGHHEKNSEP